MAASSSRLGPAQPSGGTPSAPGDPGHEACDVRSARDPGEHDGRGKGSERKQSPDEGVRSENADRGKAQREAERRQDAYVVPWHRVVALRNQAGQQSKQAVAEKG